MKLKTIHNPENEIIIVKKQISFNAQRNSGITRLKFRYQESKNGSSAR